MEDSNIFKKNADMVARKIEDEVILVPIKKNTADLEAIYNLNNDVSLRIWDLIDGKREIGEIKEALLKEFAVEEEKLIEDLKEFITDLTKIGAIKK